MINVAIDGPAGAGKSSISKAIAEKLGYIYADTGALYRAVAFFALCSGISADNRDEIIKLLDKTDIKLVYRDGKQIVTVNGEDVSDKIRTPEVSMGASAVSAIPEVRGFLLDLQKKIAAENNIIMDGRDIGTVVLPDAQLKIYLTADARERARIRFAEMKNTDGITLEDVLADIIKRDENDMNRAVSPLRQADDAVLVDTTNMSIDEVIEHISSLIRETESKER
jgi:cytidylate kinase